MSWVADCSAHLRQREHVFMSHFPPEVLPGLATDTVQVLPGLATGTVQVLPGLATGLATHTEQVCQV